jgi:hypothetical protein
VNRIRVTALAALPAVALALTSALIAAPAASADVGDILVQQVNASGQTVCTQDYVVANLSPETISDQTCAAATTAEVTNDTLESITVSTVSDPTVVGHSLGAAISLIDSVYFNMSLPGGV